MSKPTRVLLAALAVLVCLGIWLVLTASQPDTGELASSRAGSGTSSAVGAHLNVPKSESETREELRTETSEPDATSDAAPAIVIEPYVTRDLSGTLTLTDEFGNGPFLQSGTFAFWLWEQDETSYHEVQVENGEWETVLPGGVRISLAEVELGGRVAAFIAEDGPPIDVPANGYLELEAYLPKVSTLRVVAAESGVELDQITVVVERKGLPFRQHPGETGFENQVVEGASSPIELRAVQGVRIDEEVTYFVMAPSFAWTSFVMKHSIGGAYQVALKPAGSLLVRLSDDDPDPGPVFRLRQRGVPVLRYWLGWGKELLIENLAAGDYNASVEIGRDWRFVHRLGEAEVKIHAGGRTVLDLEITDGPDFDHAPLRGIVVVPSEWELSSFRLLLRLKGEIALRSESLALASSVELANVEGRDDAWHFDFPDLIASEWLVGVEPTLYAVKVQVAVGESEQIEIAVPPPADWVVRTVDRHTGEPAFVDEVRYSVPGGYTSEKRLAEKGGAANEFKIRAPFGRVVLVAEGAGYRRAIARIELDASEGEYVFEVGSECGVDMALRSGGRSVQWPEEAWTAVSKEWDGDGHSYGEEIQGEKMRVFFTHPGEYQLEIIDLEGYSEVPAFRVIVEVGTFTEVEVQATRE